MQLLQSNTQQTPCHPTTNSSTAAPHATTPHTTTAALGMGVVHGDVLCILTEIQALIASVTMMQQEKEDAVKEKEDAVKEKEDAVKEKEEAVKEKVEAVKEKQEAVNTLETLQEQLHEQQHEQLQEQQQIQKQHSAHMHQLQTTCAALETVVQKQRIAVHEVC